MRTYRELSSKSGSTPSNRKVAVSLAVLSCILSATSFGQIPDRVNYQKFKRQYEDQKQVSDRAGASVAAKKSTWDQRQQARRDVEDTKHRLQTDLTSKELEMQRSFTKG